MATDIKKLAEELVKLTVLEVNELKNVLKDEYGIEPERSERLRAIGYDPHAVQKKINELYAVAGKVRPMVSGEMEYLNSIMKILRQ